jgi:hypothetical protein
MMNAGQFSKKRPPLHKRKRTITGQAPHQPDCPAEIYRIQMSRLRQLLEI